MDNVQPVDPAYVPTFPAANLDDRYAANRAQARKIAEQGRAEPDPTLGALSVLKSQLFELVLATHQTFAPALENRLSPEELESLFPLFSAEKQVADTFLACDKAELRRRRHFAEVADGQSAPQPQRGQLQDPSGGDNGAAQSGQAENQEATDPANSESA